MLGFDLPNTVNTLRLKAHDKRIDHRIMTTQLIATSSHETLSMLAGLF